MKIAFVLPQFFCWKIDDNAFVFAFVFCVWENVTNLDLAVRAGSFAGFEVVRVPSFEMRRDTLSDNTFSIYGIDEGNGVRLKNITCYIRYHQILSAEPQACGLGENAASSIYFVSIGRVVR